MTRTSSPPADEEPNAGPDVLGEPYLAEPIDLEPDDEGDVIATLVTRKADRSTDRAVLYVHGYCDYFFQTEYAEWWAERGYDFYAVDLRKYGRSLLPHQSPNYVADLAEYYPELDEAWRRITERDGHTGVVLAAHSTGGLTVSLWAHDRQPDQLSGVVLNSPWLDLQGGLLLRAIGTAVVDRLGTLKPKFGIPRKVNNLYARSIHIDHEGEWDFDLDWKPLTSFTVYAGWLRAVRDGHARLQEGLDVAAPVLVLSSTRTTWPLRMGPDVHSCDIVLDVDQIRRWATSIGPHVTYAAIEGARHDVILSRQEARERAYAELDRWRSAYLDYEPASS